MTKIKGGAMSMKKEKYHYLIFHKRKELLQYSQKYNIREYFNWKNTNRQLRVWNTDDYWWVNFNLIEEQYYYKYKLPILRYYHDYGNYGGVVAFMVKMSHTSENLDDEFLDSLKYFSYVDGYKIHYFEMSNYLLLTTDKKYLQIAYSLKHIENTKLDEEGVDDIL